MATFALLEIPNMTALRLFEIANVLVRIDHVAGFIEYANHSVTRPAEKPCVADCIAR